jgi:hypothetical protein
MGLMVVENINGTELRFKNPGRLLLVVIGFLFWGVGFLDLLGHTSAEPDVLGLYSLPFFVVILLYGSLFFVWVMLFFNANLLSRVVDGIRFIQKKTWLSLLILTGLFFVIWVIFEWDRWSRLPGLQFALFGLVMLAILIFVFAEWSEKKDEQVWRKFVAYPLFVLFAVELVLQVLAWFGLLPGNHTIGGDFYTYERVYYNGESLRNDFANRYGWYYPDAALNDQNKRILLLGGSYVQGLQVQSEQQVSVYLTKLLNQTEPDVQNEVVSIGMPGFGLAPFLYEDTMREMPANLKSNEIIVFYHLGDDFQSPVESQNSIRYTVTGAGTAAVNPEDARLQHDLTHYFLRGFISFQLVGTIRSNYLTPRVINSWLASSNRDAGTVSAESGVEFPRRVGHVTDYYTIREPGHAAIKSTEQEILPQGNNFMFRQGPDDDRQDAVLIADNILGSAQEIARASGITLRLVTVPMFPEAFYRTVPPQSWEPELGEYDLFLPERDLVEIANRHDIPILPMGQFMLQNGLSAEDIQALYLPNEDGSFSSEGNEYFAEAIYTCFYSDQASKTCPE